MLDAPISPSEVARAFWWGLLPQIVAAAGLFLWTSRHYSGSARYDGLLFPGLLAGHPGLAIPGALLVVTAGFVQSLNKRPALRSACTLYGLGTLATGFLTWWSQMGGLVQDDRYFNTSFCGNAHVGLFECILVPFAVLLPYLFVRHAFGMRSKREQLGDPAMLLTAGMCELNALLLCLASLGPLARQAEVPVPSLGFASNYVHLLSGCGCPVVLLLVAPSLPALLLEFTSMRSSVRLGFLSLLLSANVLLLDGARIATWAGLGTH
ncbi:MAG: hypothetical protein HYZ53_06785 [Planctomycetes bacterium]|nr:hypothetical protein [Planctomycetota bacterium]